MKNLEFCKRQIQLSMLRAQWWLASATSGHCQQRKLFHGNGDLLTVDEKLDAAMQTAKRHIEIAAEFSDNLAEAEQPTENEDDRSPMSLSRRWERDY